MNELLDNLTTRAKWRFEARRDGRTFDEVAAERTLIFRVEHVLLFDRRTNRWLLHLASDPSIADDSEIVREVEDFGTSLIFGRELEREEFFLRDRRVWVVPSQNAFVAAVIRGDPPNEYSETLKRTIAQIDSDFRPELNAFTGDPQPFAPAAQILSACLQEARRPTPPPPQFRLTSAYAAIAAIVLLLLLLAAALSVRSSLRWRTFVAQLRREPGILVVKTERPWFGRARVAGLRDPRARDPAELARAAKLNPARIHFDWTNYIADDRAFGSAPRAFAIVHADSKRSLDEFKNNFHPPPTVRAAIANQTLVLAGSASYEWIVPVRERATKIAGISRINGDELVIEFDPKLVVQRFRERCGMPDGTDATVQNGRLVLSGEAPHAWLDQVRRGAMDVPGVRVLDDRNVVDVDQRAFLDAKAAIEGTTILFVLNRDTIDANAAATIALAAADVQRCFAAAQRMSVNVKLEVRGYGDAIATETENASLSLRRANAVRDALMAAEIAAQRIDSLGMGAPPPPEPGDKSAAGQFDRRVVFRVAIQP